MFKSDNTKYIYIYIFIFIIIFSLCTEGNYRKIYEQGKMEYCKGFGIENLDTDVLNEEGNLIEDNVKEDSGNYFAQIIEFFLPSSSYATMYLREIMHNSSDTLVAYS